MVRALTVAFKSIGIEKLMVMLGPIQTPAVSTGRLADRTAGGVEVVVGGTEEVVGGVEEVVRGVEEVVVGVEELAEVQKK
jgi:hypothetical protein